MQKGVFLMCPSKLLALLAVTVILAGCGTSGGDGDDDDDNGTSPTPTPTQGATPTPTPAANSQWRIEAVSADVPATDPATGLAWDAGGGAPDPYLCIQVNTAGTVYCTAFVSDTFSPVWNFTFPEAYSHASLGNEFGLVMGDDDLVDDDFMEAYQGPLQADYEGLAKTHVLTSPGGFTIRLTVKP